MGYSIAHGVYTSGSLPNPTDVSSGSVGAVRPYK